MRSLELEQNKSCNLIHNTYNVQGFGSGYGVLPGSGFQISLDPDMYPISAQGSRFGERNFTFCGLDEFSHYDDVYICIMQFSFVIKVHNANDFSSYSIQVERLCFCFLNLAESVTEGEAVP